MCYTTLYNNSDDN